MLAEALALAAPEGYVRVFVDEGPPMAALIRSLLTARQRGQVTADLRAAEHLYYVARAFRHAQPHAGPTAAIVTGLVEPLTERELEVLRLLAAGRRNRDIAEQLVVSLDTVKKHISHIHAKLGAASRTEAVAQARRLGLID